MLKCVFCNIQDLREQTPIRLKMYTSLKSTRTNQFYQFLVFVHINLLKIIRKIQILNKNPYVLNVQIQTLNLLVIPNTHAEKKTHANTFKQNETNMHERKWQRKFRKVFF